MANLGSNTSGHFFDTSFTTNGMLYSAANGVITSSTATIDSSNIITNSSQPFVFARLNTNLTNVTGDSTVVSPIKYDTIVTQQGSGYSTSTGIFTAPVAGVYICTASISWFTLTIAHTVADIEITSSTGFNVRVEANPGACQSANNVYTQESSLICFLNASDTLTVAGFVAGSTKTVGILGENFGQFSNIFIAKLF